MRCKKRETNLAETNMQSIYLHRLLPYCLYVSHCEYNRVEFIGGGIAFVYCIFSWCGNHLTEMNLLALYEHLCHLFAFFLFLGRKISPGYIQNGMHYQVKNECECKCKCARTNTYTYRRCVCVCVCACAIDYDLLMSIYNEKLSFCAWHVGIFMFNSINDEIPLVLHWMRVAHRPKPFSMLCYEFQHLTLLHDSVFDKKVFIFRVCHEFKRQQKENHFKCTKHFLILCDSVGSGLLFR